MRQVGLLFICEALTRTSSMMVFMSIALTGRRMAPDASLATLPLALVPVAMTIATIPAAQMMRRYGRRAGFQLAAMLGIAGASTCVVALWLDQFIVLCAGGFLIGSVNGFATYYRFAAGEVAPEEYRSRAISLVMAGGVIAAFVGAALATATKELHPSAPFLGTFAAIACVQALILIVVSFSRLPKPVAGETQGGGRSLGELAARPTFLLAVLGAVASWGLMSLLMNATPLSMERHQHSFGDTAQVIQWHVLGMYVPSFFTGSLIRRFGERPILFFGVALIGLSTALNLLGLEVIHYMAGLAVLGVGWNFLFIASTTILTGTYEGEAEKAKVQSTNDFLIFATMIVATFSSGALENRIGWFALNQAAAVVTAVVAIALAMLVWRERKRKIPDGLV
ncbi:MAG: MFS transporter [Gemmatimonadetes bacterium]|jgi:MFS family permease|nr:MFS transporter [Gemmatimonadota bacterium]MBT4609830.1 MFS transporter [Gemmatimonadota bacterium]MBT5059282.1 MFS transporter [Gemmatimonadota bacterium]MBT5145532.1 MFS transporter [Gemmatimonadota bacterium]MBT5591720.1 MFS transporter [Gemmatimonadota bacterium]